MKKMLIIAQPLLSWAFHTKLFDPLEQGEAGEGES